MDLPVHIYTSTKYPVIPVWTDLCLPDGGSLRIGSS
jgi:hypothetical protein